MLRRRGDWAGPGMGWASWEVRAGRGWELRLGFLAESCIQRIGDRLGGWGPMLPSTSLQPGKVTWEPARNGCPGRLLPALSIATAWTRASSKDFLVSSFLICDMGTIAWTS